MAAYPKVQDAVRSAFQQVKAANPSPKPDPLLQYNKLQPAHFAQLIQKHGEGKVLQYIKDMEALRSTNDNSSRA